MHADLARSVERASAIEALHAATAIYTAEPVVDALLDNIDWPRGERRLVDPSCGDGMFLGRALERLLAARPTMDDVELARLVEGWEIHPGAAVQARTRLEELLLAHGREGSAAAKVAGAIVRNADFLTEGPEHPCYHVCVGNPPYLRFPNVPELLRREYSALLPGHARNDLLHSFLARCASVLMPDGEIALVSADRWLFNVGAGELRQVLGQTLSIHHLERLDVATTFYRPKQRRAGTPPRVHPVAVVMRTATFDSIRLTREAIYPGQPHTPQPQVGATLGDVAQIRLAPWLGSAGIFVVGEETAATLPRDYLVPAVDTDDIVAGQLQTPRRYAIRTVPDVEPPLAIMAHLQSNLHAMAPRGRRKQAWLPPETWHRIPLDQPALLISRIARSLRPVRLPAGVLPINHNLHIVAAGTASLEAIEEILASSWANDWVRAHAAPLESGFYSLTTTLLRKLPVDTGYGAMDIQ